MALTNAEKQARFRERNIISLTASAQDIAERLLEMDRDRLVLILDLIKEQMAAAPLPFPNIPRTKAAADRECQGDRSYAVQIVRDGTRFGNGVRLGTREQAQLYASKVPDRIERDSYVTAEVIECNEPPLNSIYLDRYRRTRLTFKHDTCGSLEWRPLD